ncbi:response regulator [Paenibacillus sp. KN14-4R]|uniref:response regulator n=1 Tax=Paenibacillus sp. KN14-4R TaxID=3445773 RepID=UPI003FA0B2C1
MANKDNIHVLLIEDDPMVQEVNRMFIEQVEGFKVVGKAGNGVDGLRLIEELRPDIVFLDIFMPSLDGIGTLQQIRAISLPVDVIVVTAATDTETLRTMIRYGAIDYIIKPFKLERVKQTLERYRSRAHLLEQGKLITQEAVDEILLSSEGLKEIGHEAPETPSSLHMNADLPKGLNPNTLKQVLKVMSGHDGTMSAEEVAESVGIARVTARRYLEYLEKINVVYLEVNYGGIGRPVNRYVLRHEQKDQNKQKA